MSKPVNKTMVGAFVLGAVALGVAALLVFGSGKFLTKTVNFVMYFEGSVKGLNIGSPVMFRGVKIGSVTDVQLMFDPQNLKFTIPVYVEFDPSKISTTAALKDSGGGQYIRVLIEKGLRAQLETQSFVTGQLMVNLDFFPDKPAKFVGHDKRVIEVPTIPSTMAAISKQIQELPWQDLFNDARSAVEGINKLVNAPELHSGMKSADEVLRETSKTLKKVNEKADAILANMVETTAYAKTVAVKVDEAMSGEKGIPAQLEKTLEVTQKALTAADQALKSIEDTTSGNSYLAIELGEALRELQRTSRAFRVLADYLERHPSAVLIGKQKP